MANSNSTQAEELTVAFLTMVFDWQCGIIAGTLHMFDWNIGCVAFTNANNMSAHALHISIIVFHPWYISIVVLLFL